MKKLIFILVLLSICEIILSLYLTFWREHFWSAVADRKAQDFIEQLGIFTLVALCICFISGISGYTLSLAAIKWREKLNAKAFAVHKQNNNIENISQRIQDDCMKYPDLLLTLVFGGLKSVLYVIVFAASLILYFSWMFLVVLIVYSILGTIITHKIAKPLIKINYEQQRIEATYRNDLTLKSFNDCIFIMLGFAKKQKYLTYFQILYGQVGVIIPLIIIAPVYFSSTMTLGELMRFNSTASTVLDNMGYGVTSFGVFNKLLSCRRRLLEIGVL